MESFVFGRTGVGGASALCMVAAPGADFAEDESAIGFGLQENPDLTSTNWVDVTTIPAVTNQQSEVIVKISDGARFYRLKQ